MRTFNALLDTLINAPAERQPAIEQLIHDTFQRRKAVLALDMSGFTLTVRRDGVLAYLCQIRRMQKLTAPIVRAQRGEVVKFEADNLLAVFDDPVDAVEAALLMQQAALNDGAVNSPAIAFSIGVDYGELFLLDQVDSFGDPVNLAHKLGEDLARPGEVLISDAVRNCIAQSSTVQLRPMAISVSGMQLQAYAVTAAD